MAWGKKTVWFKCPVTVVDKKGKRKKCGRKFATLQQMVRHSETAHGGAGAGGREM